MRSSQIGSYQCEDSPLTDTHQFIVNLAGKVIIILYLYGLLSLPVDNPPFINEPTVYNETDNVRIVCMSSATPSPRRTTWQRNNVQVSTTTRALLEINAIQRNDTGIYTCCTLREVAGESPITCSNFTITVQCE